MGRILDFLRTTNRKTLAIFVGLAIGGAALGWNMILKDDLKKIADVGADKKNQSGRTAVLQQILDSEQKLAVYKPHLAASSEATWLINTVNEVADASGISLSSVDPQNPAHELDGYDKLIIQVHMRCTYHELGEFSSRIESYPKLLRISNVTLRPLIVDAEGRSPQLEIDMQLVSYAESVV